MQNNISDIEINDGIDSKYMIELYNEYLGAFFTEIFSSGIIPDIDEKLLQTYLSNPDKYQKELENIGMYYYISNGDIFQLLNTVKTLPTLNYKINSVDESKQYDKNLSKCNAILKKTKHKTLTRDLLMQLITSGTLVGIWLDSGSDVYFYTFDDLKLCFPAFRRNGNFVAWVDLKGLESMSDVNRMIFCESLNPYITISMYEKYIEKHDENHRYIELPQERTCVLRTNVLKRNQSMGIPWATQSLYAMSHKKKLKDLEKSVSNRIINSIAIVQLGNKENTAKDLNPKAKKNVLSGVKSGLERSNTSGLSVVGLPDWASIDMLEIKNGDIALGEEKFKSTNDDISMSTGLSNSLFTGSGANYAISKLNLELIYDRISIELESIEQEVYDKVFNLILPKNAFGKYNMVYSKEMPLTNKEKIDLLFKLHNSEGFALKPVIDLIDDVTFEEYITQSIHELKDMGLQNKIKPYQSSFTTSGDGSDDNGRPNIEDGDLENESTIRNKENLGNEQ